WASARTADRWSEATAGAVSLGQRGIELDPGPGIRLDLPRALERSACRVSAEPSERPGGMASHQRFAIGERGHERWQRGGVAAVAQRDGDVSQQPPAPGASDGGAAEARAEAGIVEREELGKMRRERGIDWRPRVAVPGANLLADVAAEH